MTPIPSQERKRAAIEIAGSVPNPASPPPGCHFSPRCPHSGEICFQREPEMLVITEGHSAACHLYGELDSPLERIS